MKNQTERYLRTEELYKEVIGLIPDQVLDGIGETAVRGRLDMILFAGKIEGRLSAYTDGRLFDGITPDQDLLIEDWQRIVDSI